MKRIRSLAGAALMVGFGYFCGLSQVGLDFLNAQDQANDPAAAKIYQARRAILDAKEILESNGRYSAVSDELNAYLVLSGGGNAKDDLESGRGVDPETFAALYAGKAIPDIQPLLGFNEHGQVTYNNEVVRLYSKSRLERSFADRLKYLSLDSE